VPQASVYDDSIAPLISELVKELAELVNVCGITLLKLTLLTIAVV
jgi:hypothetical protein